MKLATVRIDAATIARIVLPETVAVYDHLPDQLVVPAVLIGWADPWLEPANLCGSWIARLQLVAVAGRIEPGDQLETLEDIIGALVDGFDASPFTVDTSTAPFALEISGVTYLAAGITATTMTGD